MVDGQIRTFDVTDPAVIQAFSAVPREIFLPRELQSLAYSDAVLTVKGDTSRVMLQPMHVARLLQEAAIQPTDHVLVVAGGSGYVAAIVAHLAASVVSLECDAVLAGKAGAAFAELGLKAASSAVGALAAGHAAQAPYDVIVVPGAIETNLETLFAQLSANGALLTVTSRSGDVMRRAGKAIRCQRVAGDVSERFLFDLTAPLIPEFATSDKFVF